MATWTRAQIEVMARGAGWGARSRDVSYVAMAESSGDSSVVNSIGAVGLLQINQPVHVGSHPKWTVKWLQDPINNLSAGLVLYKEAGKFDGPWLDSRDKGDGGGWGDKVSGGSGGTGTATPAGDDPCAWAKGTPAYEYCKRGHEDPNQELPNTGQGAGNLWDLALEIGRLAQAVAKGGNWLANPANWVRIAYVVGGGVLALTAVSVIAQPTLRTSYRQVRAALPVQTTKKVVAARRRNQQASEGG